MPDDDAELALIRQRLMAEMREKAAEAAAPATAEAEDEDEDDWPDAPVHVTDHDFQETVAEYPLALVDFWAPWCGPCRMIAPSLDAIAHEMRGDVAVLKLNTDENPQTARRFGIQSLPTLGIFKNGRPVDALVGAMPKPQIVTALRRHMQRRGTPGPRRV